MSSPHALPARTISDGPIPKHAQLRDILSELCQTTLKPGDILPGERILEETYGVSRITVRRAIGDLVAAGRLRRVRGKGTFVAPNPLVSRLHLASFSDEMGAQDVKASSKILLGGRSTAPEEVSAFFGTDPSLPHTHLRRLRLGDGEPYSIDDGWYNSAYVPNLLENDIYRSVYAILDSNFRAPITEADQTVTAIAADPAVAKLLDVEPGTPLLHIIRHSRSGDRPVEWCSSVYRTDRYRLNTRVSRARDI
ncbi:GntR family transcriptional regulator [Corynebacterium flavescens]|uniref:Transcriptional regulator n=1 Tax=Corynebacterium flavescens TaxID=28028 RepID=A0A1L7CPL7_CORFL|nr:GntR family transcriptional regulator [Corynebacterium flavescens]APT87794.1 GntR family transcriptional regulator [Corynebacterium flavescens]KAA8719803.1 GntR family transcriptional regulator [Corynebacterium flavescens]GEB98574.1 transcriptional regulator [Corynebacterium flavescens]